MNTLMMRSLTTLCLTLALAFAPTLGRAVPRPAAAAQANAPQYVVAWPANRDHQPPDDLGRVIAIAAGDNQSLALKADGTVVAWNQQGTRLNVPANLTGVKAIATLHHVLFSGGAVLPHAPPATAQRSSQDQRRRAE